MNLENYGQNCFHMKNVLLSKICLRFKISVKVLLTPEAIYSGSRNNRNDVVLSAVAKYCFKLQDYG